MRSALIQAGLSVALASSLGVAGALVAVPTAAEAVPRAMAASRESSALPKDLTEANVVCPSTKTITGTTDQTPNKTITLEFPDGKKVDATINSDYSWSAPVPEGTTLKVGDTITMTILVPRYSGVVNKFTKHIFVEGVCPLTPPATTDPTTDPATDPATDPTTDSATNPATDPATNPATKPATDPTTDPESPATSPNTKPATTAVTSPAAKSDKAATTKQATKSKTRAAEKNLPQTGDPASVAAVLATGLGGLGVVAEALIHRKRH